jgi:hypothetical protein
MVEDDFLLETLSWMPEYVSGEKDRTLHYASVRFFRFYMIPSSCVVMVEDDIYIYIYKHLLGYLNVFPVKKTENIMLQLGS